MSVVVATAVNGEGRREVVGIDVGTSEDGAFWLQFLRSLVARGLSGVQLVTSGAHRGLRETIATVFAGASWPRCRTHFMTDLLSRGGGDDGADHLPAVLAGGSAHAAPAGGGAAA